MNALPIYLWKEWRDHRSIVVAYLLVAPLLIAMGVACIPESWTKTDRDWPTIGAFAGFCVAALAFGADLVAGEMRRGKLGFLARMPSDLGGAFAAKLAFFVAALLGFAAWTWLCASAAGTIALGSSWSAPRWADDDAWLGWLAVVVASWLFVVSCWMPRGSYAIPATAAVLAVLLAPALAAFTLNPFMKLRPRELESMAFWIALAGPFVAAGSLTCGWRHGGAVRSRLVWSIVPTLVAFSPVWAWAGTRVHEHRHLDPGAASFRLQAAAIGAGGRFAFVNGYHDLRAPTSSMELPESSASHPMIVDLETGSWRAAAGPGHLFWCGGLSRDPAGAGAVMLLAGKPDERMPIASEWVGCFDGATGLPLTAEQWKPLLKSARGAGSIPLQSSASTFLPDGRQVWVADWKIMERTRDGMEREVRPDFGDWWQVPIGAGVEGGDAWFDLTRRRTWTKQQLESQFHFVLLVRGGRWIVITKNSATRESQLANTRTWDPDTGEFAPVAGLAGHILRGLHPDGRLLVVEAATRERTPGALVLLDPETGSRRELALPAPLAAQLCDGFLYGFTDTGELLIKLRTGEDGKWSPRGEIWIARLDPRVDEVVCAGPFPQDLAPKVLACPDRDAVLLVAADRQLLRAWFDGRPTETLFPR